MSYYLSEQNKIIKGCIGECPFYNESMDGMECIHPYWDNHSAYENMIITHENGSKGNFPHKCPLRYGSLTIHYRLNLREDKK